MIKTIKKGAATAGVALLITLLGMTPAVAQDPGFDKLSDPLPNLKPQELADFEAGLDVFLEDFGPPFGPPQPDPKGGGPLSNTFGNNSCAGCHSHAVDPTKDPTDPTRLDRTKDGGSHNAFRARQATAYDESTGSCDHLGDLGGPGFQSNIIAARGPLASMGLAPRPQEPGSPNTGFGGEYIPLDSTAGVPVMWRDGERHAADNRTTNDLFGLGLLDAMPDWKIARRADPYDANGDGISGRVHWVTSHGGTHAGKFGRKSEVADLDEFNAEAFQNEQGVTNEEFMDDGVMVTVPLFPPPAPGDPLQITNLVGLDGVDDPEVSHHDLELLNAYVRFLAQPAQNPGAMSGRDHRKGKRLFRTTGCASCHTPVMRTGWHKSRALRYKVIRPYSDLLLHDLGPENAEGCKGDATPSEWRTEPLWGLRFVAAQQPGVFPPPNPVPPPVVALMHNGKATSVDHAIQMHGGEAAGVRNKYNALSQRQRDLLLEFLNTL